MTQPLTVGRVTAPSPLISISLLCRPPSRAPQYWLNGDRYSGGWVLGKMCGRGVKVMANGDQYDGEWADSKAHGFGMKRFADGERHAGQYAQDVRHGYGLYFYANGEKVLHTRICFCVAARSVLPPTSNRSDV